MLYISVQLCRCTQLRTVAGGWRCRACVNETKWKGRSGIGRKVATRCASPSKQSLTSQIRHRAGSTARRACQVLSTLLGDVQSGAQTGHLPTTPQPLPVHSVVPFAVKCNSSLCGIKTAFIHKQRRSETRTNAGGQEQRAAGEVSAPVSVGGNSRHADSMYASFWRALCEAGVFRRHTGTCPIMNEWEEAHQFHCHPFAEDHSLPNGVCGAHVVRKRSCKKEKTNFTSQRLWQKLRGLGK